jgi:polyhydroxyalkanoate synthesis regulator phasin
MPPQKTPDQLLQAVARQLDLVMLSRERIQQTLDEAAERGRVTRSDANLLVTELVRRGRAQTDDLVKELETLLERGRDGIETATRRARRSESVDRVVRQADKARRAVGAGGDGVPITGYDELTAAKVRARLSDLSPAELRRVRDYERRHANRKTVLEAIERTLG